MEKNYHTNSHLRIIRDKKDETTEIMSPAKVAARPIDPFQMSSDEEEEDDNDNKNGKLIGNPKTTGESSDDDNTNLKPSSSMKTKRKLKDPPYKGISSKSVVNLFPTDNNETSDMEISKEISKEGDSTINMKSNDENVTSKKRKANDADLKGELFSTIVIMKMKVRIYLTN